MSYWMQEQFGELGSAATTGAGGLILSLSQQQFTTLMPVFARQSSAPGGAIVAQVFCDGMYVQILKPSQASALADILSSDDDSVPSIHATANRVRSLAEAFESAAAQARIAELTKAIDRKNDVIEGWRSECAEHADACATAEKRIAELEAALCDIIAENPNPNLPYGHRVNEIARAALAGDEPATRGE